jgi:hypothetical protein
MGDRLSDTDRRADVFTAYVDSSFKAILILSRPAAETPTA